tara:strand:- start:3123 stop:3251 length:129 start_codon:yes stop_codon:yes gene_type:complete
LEVSNQLKKFEQLGVKDIWADKVHFIANLGKYCEKWNIRKTT